MWRKIDRKHLFFHIFNSIDSYERQEYERNKFILVIEHFLLLIILN